MNGVNDIAARVNNTLVNALNSVIAFLPELIAGLIILLIGWLIAAALRELVERGLRAINIKSWFRKAGVQKESTQNVWIKILSQLVFWTVLILFLIPVFETWGIPQVTNVINELIFYLPRVFAAVVIGFIGFVLANLLSDLARNSARTYGENAASVAGGIAYYSVLIFSALIVLSQLGIASELIQILFMGFVATFVLAAGLAFGLGGRDTARDLLNQLLEGVKKNKNK